jgi:polar amino acid transport system permease protein
MGLDFSVIPKYLDIVLLGALWTIAITVGAAVVSFFGGIFLAVVALYAPAVVRWPFRVFSFLFLGTPLLLQLFLIYFGLVQVGVDVPAFVAGVIGLGLHFAVYNSELFQTSILAVDKGQVEAARTLGLSRMQALRKVVDWQQYDRAFEGFRPGLGDWCL